MKFQKTTKNNNKNKTWISEILQKQKQQKQQNNYQMIPVMLHPYGMLDVKKSCTTNIITLTPPTSTVCTTNLSARPRSKRLKFFLSSSRRILGVLPLLPQSRKYTPASVPAFTLSPVFIVTWYERSARGKTPSVPKKNLTSAQSPLFWRENVADDGKSLHARF